MKRRFPIILLLTALCAAWLGAAPVSEIQSRVARVVADGLPRAHLSHEEFGDSIADKALRNFLNALDGDHSIFRARDVRKIRERVLVLDDELREGHLDFAFEVFDLYKERAQERVSHVEDLLETGFDLEKDETFAWKRKEAPWPETRDDQDELWRKKIKHEYVGQVVSRRMKEEEAAAKAEEPAKAGEGEKEERIDPLTPEEKILRKYQQFISVLEGHDEEWIVQLYVNSFVRAYDSHSSYLSKRANEDFDIAMRLSLTGIGALLSLDNGAAEVVRVIPGGPAEQDGRLKAGDKIIAVAQDQAEAVDILFWPLYKSVRLIRGKPGTRVVLHVIPASDPTESTVKKIDLVRDHIRLEEREAKSEIRELEGEEGDATFRLGVITLPEFYADMQGRRQGKEDPKSAARDIKALLEAMNAEDVDGLLLDLRNNGGGSLPDAVEMTGFFIDRGPVVQVKANRRVRVLRDPRKGTLFEKPLVVLVNRQSASASEILAGALQDYNRAVIVGDSKTHGKGSVQTLFPLDRRNNALGSLKITTAGFYRVDGRSTQLKGVVPDIIVPSALDVMEVGEEFLPNVIDWSMVDPATYKALPGMPGVIERLNMRSAERRKDDERYAAYGDLLDRLEENLAMTEIPLGLEERLELARKNQELEDLQKKLTATPGEEEAEGDEEKQDDLILDEALFILRDLVREGEGFAGIEPAGATAHRPSGSTHALPE